MKTSFALVDCNSFFCSCEQVFNPKLRNKPVVVLSNNDGVVIARSTEAKRVGIKMGEPHHQAKGKFTKHKVHVFSSNYSLYGDMSDRVMTILRSMCPEVEVYSIDEAFINCTLIPEPERLGFAQQIKKEIQKSTGIPVSVGIGPTKVLAKVANEVAKKNQSNVCDLTTEKSQETVLGKFPVENIWGVGKQSAKKLHRNHIYTAEALKNTSLGQVERLLTITGKRIVEELRGISHDTLEIADLIRKQIVSSRSFGRPVYSLEELEEACSSYLEKASEKLRGQNSLCGEVRVFVCTNHFKSVRQYYNSAAVKPFEPSASTLVLNRAALKALRTVYQKGIEYKKVGVMLCRLIDAKNFYPTFFFDKAQKQSDERLMLALDKINYKFGRGTLQTASAGFKKSWKMQSKSCSQRYTTDWSELLTVRVNN